MTKWVCKHTMPIAQVWLLTLGLGAMSHFMSFIQSPYLLNIGLPRWFLEGDIQCNMLGAQRHLRVSQGYAARKWQNSWVQQRNACPVGCIVPV